MKASGVRTFSTKLNKLMQDSGESDVPVFSAAKAYRQQGVECFAEDSTGRHSLYFVANYSSEQEVFVFTLSALVEHTDTPLNFVHKFECLVNGEPPEGELPSPQNVYFYFLSLYGELLDHLVNKQFVPEVSLLQRFAYDMGLVGSIVAHKATRYSREISLEASDFKGSSKFSFCISSGQGGIASLSVWPYYQPCTSGTHYSMGVASGSEAAFLPQHITAQVAWRCLAMLMELYRVDQELALQAKRHTSSH